MEYLGRYTHRAALSNERLVSLADGIVRFRKDYAHGNRVKTMALPATEFLQRFLLHVLPDGFVRIRHFALLANRGRTAKLARCRELLAAPPPAATPTGESVAALIRRLTGVDITRCPVCAAWGACTSSATCGPGRSPSPSRTPHETPLGAAPFRRAHTPPLAEAGSGLFPSPLPARGPHSCPPRPLPATSASPRVQPGPAAESSFPQGRHRDTIPIA